MTPEEEEILIAKWLAGEVSKAELEKVLSAEEIAKFEAMVAEVDSWTLPQVDQARGWQRLQARKQQAPAGKVRSLWRPAMAVAASLTLLLVAYFGWFAQDGVTEYTTAAGEQQRITLPDGSTVQLNTSSSLSYVPDTWEDTRELDLSGEAFFSVAKGQTFTVNTGQGSVTVLGTQFNVNQRGDYLTVDCYEGRVGVEVPGDNQMHQLTPGRGIRFRSGSEVKARSIDGSAPRWILDSAATRFQSAALGEVLLAVEAQFGVPVNAEKAVDIDRTFSGSFLHENIEVALRMVCQPLGLQFRGQADDGYEVYTP